MVRSQPQGHADVEQKVGVVRSLPQGQHDVEQKVGVVKSLPQDCAMPGFMLMIQSTVSSSSVML